MSHDSADWYPSSAQNGYVANDLNTEPEDYNYYTFEADTSSSGMIHYLKCN